VDMSRYLDLFVSEARDHLQSAGEEMERLAAAPPDQEPLNALFRHFHSLKGMAASMGFEEIMHLSHALEDLFDEIRKEPARAGTPGLADLVLEALDAAASLVESASRGSREFPSQAPLMERIERLAAEVQAGAPAPPATPPCAPAGAAPRAAADASRPERPASIFRCRLQIDAEAELPAARAALVIRQFESLGAILTTTPAREALGRAPFDGTLTVLLSSSLPRARVAAAIEEMLDVASYSLTEELLPGEPAARAEGAREAETGLPATIRIPTAALDHFLETLGELITWRGSLGAALRQRDLRAAAEGHERLARAIDRLRGEVMEIRLLPFEHIVPHLNQTVRGLARQTGKRVALQISGTDVALDRAVLEEILDPLNHILRNAVDHGIEPPEGRLAAGKEPTGRILIAVSREGDRVRIRIEDDGRGMDTGAILATAIRDGFVTAQGAAALGPEDVLMLTTIPGFSTATATTEISGRGVGMDVVRTRIEKLDGRVGLQSRPGAGLAVLLDLPLTVAGIDAILV